METEYACVWYVRSVVVGRLGEADPGRSRRWVRVEPYGVSHGLARMLYYAWVSSASGEEVEGI